MSHRIVSLFINRLCHSPLRRAAILLSMLVVSSLTLSCSIRTPAKPVARTPSFLDYAALGDLEMVKKQVTARPELVFTKNKSGWTALHLAAYAEHYEVAAFLVAHKADVNARNEDGKTPLQLAGMEQHDDVVELLRRHGGLE